MKLRCVQIHHMLSPDFFCDMHLPYKLARKSAKGTVAGLPCGYLDLKTQTFDTGASAQ